MPDALTITGATKRFGATENLDAFGALAGLRGKDLAERVRWALDWTGLADRSREPVKRFSGGMKRRLNLACGVLHRPLVLLLDEPTVGVDPQSRERIWEMLGELHREGAAILLTTHQLDEAQQVAERIVIIDRGKVIAAGTFEELLAETVGRERRVVVRTGSGETVTRAVTDVAKELPGIVAGLSDDVVDLRVVTPTLQAVFLHLTGRELRE
jgi:ABC-2 type transport system ATP-binding protein